ncbi:uncharacterized protein SPAPADRAFT_61517 [Spathaspora passalidarum NRRL Y-27907]|uniref:Mtf2-like C-terminal domain-containing protein n=1 Tax=Spathaspora passalidarum (strain NRRL Y-27907 / 11-Y1) TaxID=619300 RepID=G3AN36_SPAPN|nr:uncharacterized protein SPAPADRAFT_61517 [Spathaspora passalidarum NRRL Y-27907]EGW32450.1 hypothetical protein SPAPADRAFT_61517 [Spathaspora passalidarum NRRL Y-27907]
MKRIAPLIWQSGRILLPHTSRIPRRNLFISPRLSNISKDDSKDTNKQDAPEMPSWGDLFSDLETEGVKQSDKDLVNDVDGFEYINENCEEGVPVSKHEQELFELEDEAATELNEGNAKASSPFEQLFSNIETVNQDRDAKLNSLLDMDMAQTKSDEKLNSLLDMDMFLSEDTALENATKTRLVDEENYPIFQNLLKPQFSLARDLGKFTKDAYDEVEPVNADYVRKKLDTESSLASKRITILNLDFRLRQDLFEKTASALAPTLGIMNNSETSEQLYNFIAPLLTDVSHQLKSNANDIYLRDIFVDKNKHRWCDAHEELMKSIAKSSKESPSKPMVNVLTIPTILNHALKLLTFKFHNGQLALALFNMLKKDPQLYNFSCNQGTYNEILRIHWVYFGHLDLREFEKTIVEMNLLGYKGDFVTYNILRTVINEYTAMRNGHSDYNEYSSLFTLEDNMRINEFKNKFYELRTMLSSVEPKRDPYQSTDTTAGPMAGYFNL